MKCPACDFENLDHAVSCMGCGITLVAQDKSPPPPPLSAEDFQELNLSRPQIYDEMRVGEVLSQTFSTYFRNLVPFFVITVITLSPIILVLMWIAVGAPGLEDPSSAGVVVGFVVIVASLFAAPLATGALTFGVLQHLRERQVRFGDCIVVGLKMMVTIILVSILQGLATFAGIILLIIPGIIAAVGLSASVPAAVEERPGAIGALRRSWELTRGYRWTIFGVFFVINIIQKGIELVANTTAAASPLAGMLISNVGMVLNVGWTATASALIYYQLRSIKERLDLNEMASVFD